MLYYYAKPRRTKSGGWTGPWDDGADFSFKQVLDNKYSVTDLGGSLPYEPEGFGDTNTWTMACRVDMGGAQTSSRYYMGSRGNTFGADGSTQIRRMTNDGGTRQSLYTWNEGSLTAYHNVFGPAGTEPLTGTYIVMMSWDGVSDTYCYMNDHPEGSAPYSTYPPAMRNLGYFDSRQQTMTIDMGAVWCGRFMTKAEFDAMVPVWLTEPGP